MMGSKTGRGIGMEEVRSRFEQWRNGRSGKAPIPAELWAAAIETARREGVNRTAQELHLDGGQLKGLLVPADSGAGEVLAEVAGIQAVIDVVDHHYGGALTKDRRQLLPPFHRIAGRGEQRAFSPAGNQRDHLGEQRSAGCCNRRWWFRRASPPGCCPPP